MKKKICTIIAISCAIIVLGVAGASDLNRMSTLRAAVVGLLALGGMITSMYVGGFFE